MLLFYQVNTVQGNLPVGQVTTKHDFHFSVYRAQTISLYTNFSRCKLHTMQRGVKNIVWIWNVQLRFAPPHKHVPTPGLAEAWHFIMHSCDVCGSQELIGLQET